MRKRKSRFLSVRINKELLEDANQVADKLGISLSQLIRNGIKNFITTMGVCDDVVAEKAELEEYVKHLDKKNEELKIEHAKAESFIEEMVSKNQQLSERNVGLKQSIERKAGMHTAEVQLLQDKLSKQNLSLKHKEKLCLSLELMIDQLNLELDLWKQHPFRMWHRSKMKGRSKDATD